MNHYVLRNPRFSNTEFAFGEEHPINYNTGSARYCAECNQPISALEWLPPFEVKVSKGNIGDFVFGTFSGFLVSKLVKSEYEKSKLTGLSNFRKVKLMHKNKEVTKEYFYPEISLISAQVNLNNIEFEKKLNCETCQIGGGIINKINSIDFLKGEKLVKDVFFSITIGQGIIFVSEIFKSFLVQKGFTNANLIQASKYSWDSLNP